MKRKEKTDTRDAGGKINSRGDYMGAALPNLSQSQVNKSIFKKRKRKKRREKKKRKKKKRGGITPQKHFTCGCLPCSKEEIRIIKPQIQVLHRGWRSSHWWAENEDVRLLGELSHCLTAQPPLMNWLHYYGAEIYVGDSKFWWPLTTSLNLNG